MSQEFRRKLKEARAKLHLSQSKFAALLGVSLKTLQAWEMDRYTPDPLKLNLLEDKIDQLLAQN